MKFKYRLISMVVFGLLACQTVTYNGETSLKDNSYINLEINGNAILHNIDVKELAKFSSSIKAYKSSFNAIESVASVECYECNAVKVKAVSLAIHENSHVDQAEVKNNVSVENSDVSNMSFSGIEGLFKNAKIKSIKNTGFINKRVIILVDSEVMGDISFESTEECKVLLKGNSKVHGSVINGMVEN